MLISLIIVHKKVKISLTCSFCTHQNQVNELETSLLILFTLNVSFVFDLYNDILMIC